MWVLRVVSGEKGIGGKFKRKIGIVRQERRVFRDGGFDEVTVFCKADRIRWKKIRKVLGSKPICAVMEREIRPPVGCGVMKYSSLDFAERLLFRTFMQTVRTQRPSSVGIADARGEWVAAVEELLMLAGQVRVWTPCAPRYEELVSRAVEEYGTAPVISDDPAVLRGVSAAYLPMGCEVSVPVGCGAVFSREQGFAVSAAGLALPEDLAALIPPEISPLDFAAAAVEVGLVAENEVGCRTLARNGGERSLLGIYKQISNNKNG